MAINPAVLAAQSGMQHGTHSKMNLCGYDSFLHATICGGGTSHSPPPPPPPPAVATAQPVAAMTIHNLYTNIQQQQQQQQLIATVQPIMTAVPSSQSTPAKVFLNSTTHQIKTSKILRSGSYSQQQQQQQQQQSLTTHNSPQYHGYQRLSSSNAHHSHSPHHIQQLHQQCANKLAALNLTGAQLERTPPVENVEKWLKHNGSGGGRQERKASGATKYADNAIYAKLSEKLQESALSTHNQRRKHKSAHKTRTPVTRKVATATEKKTFSTANGVHSSSSNTSIGTYAALIPIHGDPAECENLIAPTTTDDEAINEAPSALLFGACQIDLQKTAVTSTPIKNTTGSSASEAMDEERNVMASANLLDLSDAAAVEAEAEKMTPEVDLDLTLRADEVTAGVDQIGPAVDVGAQGEVEEEDDDEEEAGESASAANTSGSGSSLIHRYVHEHIHHHYHHFEEKDE
ncbi:unnamed protein product [Ceratitis capitata]|uniref:(Mediterranean fruit fly) hypothetical protein n=1 Tax=Ceratitis capitata TaxID=7213 RepID=A0A811V5T0_CERCA|nr:unnamed protein product [Ceratitis capitata]